MMDTILFEKLRELQHILRRSEIFKIPNSEESQVVGKLKEVHLKLRCAEKCSLEFCISPFLAILSLPSLSSPYMICCLESLKEFLRVGLFDDEQWKDERAIVLSSIISTVTSCKFVSTDLSLDSKCYFEIVQVLYDILAAIADVEGLLNFAECIEYCLAVVDGTKSIEHLSSIPIVIVAQEALVLAANKLSRRIASPIADKLSNCTRISDCWLQWIRYCLEVLQTRRQSVWYDECARATPLKRFSHEKPSSYHCSNVVLSLKFLKHLILPVSVSENFSLLLQRSDVFQLILVEIGFSIIDVALSEISVDEFREIMHISVAIITSRSNEWNPFISQFLRQVIVKKLHGLYHLFHKQIGFDHPFSSFFKGNANLYVDTNLEILEIVLEGLTDLMANPNFFALLYTTFDCQFSSQDVLQPIVGVVSQCSSLVLTTGTERLGELKDVGIAVVQTFKQILHCFSARLSNCVEEKPFPRATLLSKSKRVHVVAAEKFCAKPSQCFLYLGELDLFDTPLDAKAVAYYLRHGPFLPKDKVGSYLGELGKSDGEVSFDSVKFHKEVLAEYVGTFDFNGLDTLSCLRIFLSAFRLPGEAQQIDRILIAFSEHCHLHSRDSSLGIVENADVTYLLLFSIIMLNTDRHNPNIRPEKKMTMEQFVRNNLFYGKEVNQSRPIPSEYLEQIFKSIEVFPLRTEAREYMGVLTIEEWIDQLLWSRRALHQRAIHRTGNENSVLESVCNFSFEEAMFGSVAEYLLLPSLSVHLYNVLLCASVNDPHHDPNGESWWKERTGRLLDLSCDFLHEILLLCGKLHRHDIIDTVIFIMYEICFLKESKVGSKFTEIGFRSFHPDGMYVEPHDSSCHPTFPNMIFYERLTRPSMQRALITLLTVISNFADQIAHWEVVVFVLSQLRDFALLPKAIVDFGEDDMLPTIVRAKFEETLSSLNPLPSVSQSEFTRCSGSKKLSTLQFIGEALFGTSTPDNSDTSEESPFDKYFQLINLKNARILSGYNNEIHPLWLESTRNLRIGIEKTAVASLISESKFLSDGALCNFLMSVIRAGERKLVHSALPKVEAVNKLSAPSCIFGFMEQCNRQLDFSKILSFASASWLEAVLVEVVLRNRDRFNLCWPIVLSHYSSTICDSNFSLSRVAELQLNGVLKLSVRLLARENCMSALLDFLGKLCSIQQDIDSSYPDTNKIAKLSPTLVILADQLMDGMWRLLTNNVEVLPKLSLEQWEVLFCIIAAGSELTDFASFKAFEIMSWLLQEPRLVANIPVFSVMALRPLVRNVKCVAFVSEGAIKLLSYMLSRLEPVLDQVMSAESEEEEEEFLADSHWMVWKTCWLPILQAIFIGCLDTRFQVRFVAIHEICQIFALKHIQSVPQKLLIDVIVHKFIPAATKLLVDVTTDTDVDSVAHASIQLSTRTIPQYDGFSFSNKKEDPLFGEGVVIEIVKTMEHLILTITDKLFSHPTYDKLWLEVLNFFVSTVESCQKSNKTEVATIAIQCVKKMYNMLTSEERFLQKPGLKSVTWDYVAKIVSQMDTTQLNDVQS